MSTYQIFHLPKEAPALTGGWYCNFFLTGTTTPTPVYTTSALSTTHPADVEADAAGVLPVVYLDPSIVYKVNVYDENDVLQYTADPANDSILSQAVIGGLLYPITTAETSAGVTPSNYAYEPGDVRRYGASTALSDNSSAVQDAISVCSSAGGGVVTFPYGEFTFTSGIDLSGEHCIVIQGVGGRTVGGHHNGTTIKYTGTAARFADLRTSFGCYFQDVQLVWSSASFTGYMVDFAHATSSDSAYGGLKNCLVGSYDGTLTNGVGVNADQAIILTFDNCLFDSGDAAIDGQDPDGGSYSNVIKVKDCTFANTGSVPIRYLGESWSITGCTFEPRDGGAATGVAGALLTTSDTPVKGLNFAGNWLGDVATGTSTWLTLYGSGIHIHGGNRFGGTAGANAISLNATSGVVVEGNSFTQFAAAVAFETATCTNFIEQGNAFSSVTNRFAGAANCDSFAQGTAEEYTELPNGMCIQSGIQTITVGATGETVTFPKPFLTGTTPKVVATVMDGTDYQNTVNASTPTNADVIIKVGGTAGDSPVHWMAFGRVA